MERLPPVTWARRWRRPRQADAFLLSCPKTGRTWLRVMIAEALARHYALPDLAGTERSRPARVPGVPRLVAKHDGTPDKKVSREISGDRSEYADCRVILLVRDLRDTVVSSYFQATRRERCFEGDVSSYLRWPRGSFESMLRYYNVRAAQRTVPREFMLVRYEDMHADASGELRRVLGFLRLDSVADSTIRDSVEHASFGSMRSREALRPADGTPLAAGRVGDPESSKTRRGKIGGYADYLPPEDVAWIDARIDSELDPFYGYSRSPPPRPAAP